MANSNSISVQEAVSPSWSAGVVITSSPMLTWRKVPNQEKVESKVGGTAQKMVIQYRNEKLMFREERKNSIVKNERRNGTRKIFNITVPYCTVWQTYLEIWLGGPQPVYHEQIRHFQTCHHHLGKGWTDGQKKKQTCYNEQGLHTIISKQNSMVQNSFPMQ